MHIILVAFFAVAAVRAHDERQSKQYCPANNLADGGNAQEDNDNYNYECIQICRYISSDANPVTGSLLKQEDFTSCGEDDNVTNLKANEKQCVNGKCFQSDCVDTCKDLATKHGTTLRNIRVDTTENVFSCDFGGGVISQGFPLNGQCELKNQIEFYGPQRDDDNSDVYLNNYVADADAECKARFGDDGVSARVGNKGCFFMCVNNGNVLATKYIQPSGSNCGDKNSCLFSNCQNNICIDNCNSTANGGILMNIIQDGNIADEADCYFQGRSTLAIVKLPFPLKCEVNDRADEDSNGSKNSENTINGGVINNNSSDNNTQASGIGTHQKGNNSSQSFTGK